MDCGDGGNNRSNISNHCHHYETSKVNKSHARFGETFLLCLGLFVRFPLGLPSFISSCALGGVFSIRRSTSSRRLSSVLAMTKKRPTRIVAPAEYKLPANFNREIGRIMVHWAYFENASRRVLWDMLKVGPKIGRVAVRDPRIDDRLEMILDIAYLNKIKIDQSRIKTLISRTNEVLKWRDLVAHGIWIPTGSGWLVQMIGGNYPKDYETEHRKRRIHPEGVNVDVDGLRTVTDGIDMLIDEITSIGADIQAQLRQSPETGRE
jgi:hypothetical protein